MEFLSCLLSCFSSPKSNTANSSQKKLSPTLLERHWCRQFSLRELQLATKSFDQTSIIEGCFGIVYKGCIDDGATKIAIKRHKKEPNSTQRLHEIRNEVQFLCQLHHPNLLSFVGFCDNQNELILVYDFMANGSLHDHLHRHNKYKDDPLSWKRRLEICIGIARGLHYLHTGAKNVIIHRDMQTNNILLDKNWVPKIANFNLSKKESNTVSMSKTKKLVRMNSYNVSRLIDPEYIVGGKLTEKTDVFAFGLVLLEVVTRKTTPRCLILEENDIDQIMDPFFKEKTAPECWQKFIDIVERCLVAKGIDRPTMGEVEMGLEYALQQQESAETKNKSDSIKHIDDHGFNSGLNQVYKSLFLPK